MRLARHLGVPPSFVTKMATGEKAVPVRHGAQIEQFTGGAVTRQDLFPYEWQRIWPELAVSAQNHAQPSANGSFVAANTNTVANAEA